MANASFYESFVMRPIREAPKSKMKPSQYVLSSQRPTKGFSSSMLKISSDEIQIVARGAAPLDKQGGRFFCQHGVTIASSALHNHTLANTGEDGRGCQISTLHLYYTHFCWALLYPDLVDFGWWLLYGKYQIITNNAKGYWAKPYKWFKLHQPRWICSCLQSQFKSQSD